MHRFLPCRARCFGLVGLAALTVSAFAPAAAQTQRSAVAVLPLENSSGDATQDFFAEGMTDEIAAALSSARGIDVVARSSSFRLKGAKRDIKAAGEQLHARYVVQGAARLVADRVRLNLALLQASDGKQLWAEEYYAESPNIRYRGRCGGKNRCRAESSGGLRRYADPQPQRFV